MTLLSIARPSAMAVSRHQLLSREDVSCSRAGSFCCPLSRGWEQFAPWIAWMLIAATSLVHVLSAQVLSANVDA